MNYALVLAGGTRQRMQPVSMPKQFLTVYGKPIIAYTIEKLVSCREIDSIFLVCNPEWMDHMRDIIGKFQLSKINGIIAGGHDRQESIRNGLRALSIKKPQDDDIVVIHDAVRPLADKGILKENIRVAGQYGGAMTVRKAEESVVITNKDAVLFSDFFKREDTYSMTSPQTFRLKALIHAYQTIEGREQQIPLLDAAMVYASAGNAVCLVKENNRNIKVTTPEDYYILKAMLEFEENERVLGLKKI